jgi:hypothetical protein
MKRWTLGFLAALLLAGCASAGTEAERRPAARANLLTQEEIRNARYNNLYDIVVALRPNWLNQRGPISFADPEAGKVLVYLNEVHAGGAEYLRQVSVLDVESMHYFNATEASARFGFRQSGGAAIVIRTIPVPR